MRHSVNLNLSLYDIEDKWGHEFWNENFIVLDAEIASLREKTESLNTDTAEFTKSVIAPKFIGVSTSSEKLENSVNVSIGNQLLTFDGTQDLIFDLVSINAADREHTHAYLPLDGGIVTGNIAANLFEGPSTSTKKLETPINVTIGDTTKEFDGSTSIEFTKKEIGATSSSGVSGAEEDNIIVIEGNKIVQTYTSGMVRTTLLSNGLCEETLTDEMGNIISTTTTTIGSNTIQTVTVVVE